MTTEHEALTATTYRLAWEISGMTPEEVDAFHRTLGLLPSLHPAQTHVWLPGYRAGRAQVDEDVRRLVEAVVRPHVLFWCGADLDDSGNNFCRRWATWAFHDWEWSAWRCYEHAHQKPDWWDDEEQGEWVTQYEEDAKAVALVAALEPFKAVAPPADAEEVER